MGTLESSEFNVIGINRKSIFSLDEARTLFPIIFRLTKSYSERVDVLVRKIEAHSKNKNTPNDALINSLEGDVDRLVLEWQTKVQKLGGLPNGRWVVDFDSGDGYFCWKYPEPAIEFWHHYRDGFSKRVQISAMTIHEPVSRLAPVETVNEL